MADRPGEGATRVTSTIKVPEKTSVPFALTPPSPAVTLDLLPEHRVAGEGAKRGCRRYPFRRNTLPSGGHCPSPLPLHPEGGEGGRQAG